jgi:hypothetical protein
MATENCAWRLCGDYTHRTAPSPGNNAAGGPVCSPDASSPPLTRSFP